LLIKKHYGDDMNQSDDDIVIHPVKTRKDPEVPQTGFLFVNPGEANLALSKVMDEGGKRCFLHNSQLVVTADRAKFVAGPAIGAPVATLVMEKLIALGATHIVLMGWCGAVDQQYHIGDVVVPTGGVSGEGTSQYYGGNKEPEPSAKATDYVQNLLSGNNIEWKGGNIWSTDAPYRESRSYLAELNKQRQVIGVDMEYSALCNVARFRKIQFSAVLLVSDEIWGNSWKPGFKNSEFKKRTKLLVELLLQAEV
jgi:uridine phosphorylase